MMTQKNIFFHLFLATSVLSANESLPMPDDFASLLEDMSDIATKKSLNVDYLPSVVTVIDAQTYRDAGIQTLGEALEMLPGIQTQLSPMGYAMTTVRGLKNPNAYLSDKIKVMIDGVPIYNELSGTSYFYMDLSLQIVDKIEVLRGPGSTMYGAGSFYGTINVITKMGNNRPEERISAGIGSYGYRMLSTNLYENIGDWDIYLDGYYQQNDKSLYWEDRGGYTEEAMKDFSVGFRAKNGGLEFLTRFKRNHTGNFYEFESKLDLLPWEEGYHENSYFLSQLSYTTDFSGYQLETRANYTVHGLDLHTDISGVNGVKNRLGVVDIVLNDGFYIEQKIQEQNLELESILTLPNFYNNDVMLGVGIRQASVTKDNFFSTVENAMLPNLEAIKNHPNYDSFKYNEEKESAFWHNPTRSLINDSHTDRTNVYAYLQDLIAVTDQVDVVLGLRVDNYSDFGTQLSKRAALVYRASDEAIFKLLYGSAFRAPTLIEAYENGHINMRAGDPDLKPEETNTYEAVAIYAPNFSHKFMLNLYYSHLNNVIDLEEYPNTDPGYQNFDSRESRGAEFEYYFRPNTTHNLYFNASYIDAEYTIPPEEGEIPHNQSMPDISTVMLKAMYVFRPSDRLTFGTTWRYYNETTETELQWVAEDGRDATVDPYHVVDETVTFKLTPLSQLQLTVKNLFNADVRYPVYYYLTDSGIPREGTNFFLSFEQKF